MTQNFWDNIIYSTKIGYGISESNRGYSRVYSTKGKSENVLQNALNGKNIVTLKTVKGKTEKNDIQKMRNAGYEIKAVHLTDGYENYIIFKKK